MTDYISFFITLILILLITKRGKNTKDKLEGKVEFKFGKIPIVCFALFIIVWSVIVVLGIIILIDKKDTSSLLIFIFTLVMMLIFVLMFIYTLKKKIIYNNGVFTYMPMFGKTKKFKYSEIQRIKYQTKEGVKVYMQDKTKFFINEQMTNFNLIYNKLNDEFCL